MEETWREHGETIEEPFMELPWVALHDPSTVPSRKLGESMERPYRDLRETVVRPWCDRGGTLEEA